MLRGFCARGLGRERRRPAREGNSCGPSNRDDRNEKLPEKTKNSKTQKHKIANATSEPQKHKKMEFHCGGMREPGRRVLYTLGGFIPARWKLLVYYSIL